MTTRLYLHKNFIAEVKRLPDKSALVTISEREVRVVPGKILECYETGSRGAAASARKTMKKLARA
jgi:hypothetical protein